jgi:hypothetical protein
VSRARRRLAALAAAALAAAAAPAPAGAHGRSTSTSAWEIDAAEPASARVLVRAAWQDLQRALPPLGGVTPDALAWQPELARAVADYLTEHHVLRAGATPCPVTSPPAAVPTPDPTHYALRWRVGCATAGALAIRADAFLEAVPSHLHLARVRRGDARAVERVFVLGAEEFALDAGGTAPPRASSLAEFVRLGVAHIATGADHLAFLLALLLVGVGAAEVATIVTGFTVAHSVTLALGVFGVVRPRAATVEALIGLSIAVVALENAALTVGPRVRRGILVGLGALVGASAAGSLAGRVAVPASALAGIGLFSLCYFGLLGHVARPFRLRWFLAFVFGLIHGLGFAGVLAQMQLPREGIARALFGFNAGVELGQLALVALAWPLLRAGLSGPAARRRLVAQAGSAAVLAAGLFWFATRALA